MERQMVGLSTDQWLPAPLATTAVAISVDRARARIQLAVESNSVDTRHSFRPSAYAAKTRRLTHTTEPLKLRFVRLNQLFVVGVLTYWASDAIKSWYLTKPGALDPS
jgi:hypothetical protein